MFTPFSVTGCSLKLLNLGERGIISFCNIQDETTRRKLISLGVRTGAAISVEQNFPTLLIRVGNILVEIDKEIACVIYVRIQ